MAGTAVDEKPGLCDWASVCLPGVCMSISLTGTAVVLPIIGRALGGSALALNWAANTSISAFGSALMAAGATADAHGRRRRRVFPGGGLVHALTSASLREAAIRMDSPLRGTILNASA